MVDLWEYSSRLPDFNWKQRIIKGNIPAEILSIKICAKRIFKNREDPFSSSEFICVLSYENITFYVRYDHNLLMISTVHDCVQMRSKYIFCTLSEFEVCLLDGCKILAVGQIHSL